MYGDLRLLVARAKVETSRNLCYWCLSFCLLGELFAQPPLIVYDP